jgi:palmitoyl-protein thioesterase
MMMTARTGATNVAPIFSAPWTWLLLLATVGLAAEIPAHTAEECTIYDRKAHPILCDMTDRLRVDPVAVSEELHAWAEEHRRLVDITTYESDGTAAEKRRRLGATERVSVPVVFAHGMGDSCFNSGMQHIAAHVSTLLGGTYSTCIPTGATQSEDTNNGYFLNMDASVDVFAQAIQQDPQLAHGFHAIGFSQGNNIIRGYIAKYNDPPVKTFLSVNGVNAGEGAVPYCRPGHVTGGMCDLLMEQASRAAYTNYAQQHSFQANYWRDPRASEFPVYQKYGQLANWNNEGLVFNQTLKDNYAKTETFVWIMATDDGMVWPKEGEQWGAPDPKNPFQNILPREQTEWFQKDLFGLKTAEDAGKNHYESFKGDHLQFSMDDFDGWISTYLA